MPSLRVTDLSSESIYGRVPMRACRGHNGMGPDAPSLGEGGTARLPDSDAGPAFI
jgi:hypothetical protein